MESPLLYDLFVMLFCKMFFSLLSPVKVKWYLRELIEVVKICKELIRTLKG